MKSYTSLPAFDLGLVTMTAIWSDAVLARATNVFVILTCHDAFKRAIPGASLYTIHVSAPATKPIHISSAVRSPKAGKSRSNTLSLPLL